MMDLKGKKYILTDFFDTIMFRYIHPYQVINRVSFIIGHDYSIDPNLISSIRNSCHASNAKSLFGALYENLRAKHYLLNFNKESFIQNAIEIEESVEIGCQYPNLHYINKLREWNALGLKIIIISDFHLEESSIRSFLIAKNIDLSLFDSVFVSSDYGCTKQDGMLYQVVLDKLGIEDKSEVIMFGDNRISDVDSAQKNGIGAIYIPNYSQKIKYQLSRFLNTDYSKRAAIQIRKDCYKYNSPFVEYSIPFYYSIKRIYKELTTKGEKSVSFLSREGHFLRRAFIQYQNIYVNKKHQIESRYLKCSRRAANALELEHLKDLHKTRISLFDWLMAHGFSKKKIDDITNSFQISREQLYDDSFVLAESPTYKLLIKNEDFTNYVNDHFYDNKTIARRYYEQFLSDGKLNIVDIGWHGTMQNIIAETLKVPTFGYYLGLYSSTSHDDRIGVLFENCPKDGIVSDYSYILVANTQLYEQLTAAPHGSAIGYTLDENGSILVEEEWADNEKELYESIISQKQEEILLVMRGLYAWCEDDSFKNGCRLSAKTVLRSSLIANKQRLSFLNRLDQGFINNCNAQVKGIVYKPKHAKVRFDIISAPEHYVNYYAKIQRYLQNKNKFLQTIYHPFSWFLYGYLWSFVRIKTILKK